MTKNEVMQMALDALENSYDAINSWGGYASTYFQEKHDLEADVSECRKSIEVLRAALAQPEPEPVAFRASFEGIWFVASKREVIEREFAKLNVVAEIGPLYTAPPQRKPLSPDDIAAILRDPNIAEMHQGNWLVLPYAYARAIEAAHGIKGLI